jgi:CheY-like chemotaxis protein
LRTIQTSTESIGISNLLTVPQHGQRNKNEPAKSFLLRVPKSKETIVLEHSRAFVNSIRPVYSANEHPTIMTPSHEDDDKLLETYESQEEDNYKEGGMVKLFGGEKSKKKKKDEKRLQGPLLDGINKQNGFGNLNGNGNSNGQGNGNPTHIRSSSRRISDHKSTGVGTDGKSEMEACEGRFGLLVDDDNFNHQAYQFQLGPIVKDSKLRLESRFDGQEAVEFVETLLKRGEPLPSFVIMDYEMPNLKGVEATKKIQNLCNEYGREPLNVLGVTGNSRTQDIEEGIKAGMFSVLVKPVSGAKLMEKLKVFV